jgi:hypothetical protein
MQLKLLALAGALLLSGCGSLPMTEQTGMPVPSERIYSDFATRSAGKAEVIILRDAAFTGAACEHDIYIDNVKATSIEESEKARLFVSPGQHVFRAESGGWACTLQPSELDVDLQAGKKYLYRLYMPMAGRLSFEPVR